MADNNGSQTFTYDGTDANGQAETRGLVTKTEVSSGGVTHSAVAAYDAQGAATVEKLPGGIIRRHSYDPAGELIDLTYSGKGTDPETGASVADQQWFGWSARSDAAGRTVREWSTDGGSAYTAAEGAQAVSSDRRYSYDKAARLIRVDETLNTRAVAPLCTRRGYGFDVNGNRTSQTTASNPTDCADTGAVATTRAYNEADQPVTGANGQGSYVYDSLGRQTSIPAADTIKPANGAMSLAYYDSDAAQSVAQGDTKVTFTLDGAGRRLVQNTTVGPLVTPDVVAGTVTRHYTDSSDNPAWTVDQRGDQQVTTRFAGLTGDGMGITFTTINGTTTAELALAGLRGDVNATVKLDGTNPANGIDTWSDYTEYGQPTTAKTATVGGAAGAGYGWLGAHERATLDALGITLMGARLYNQATGLFTSLDPEYQGGDTAYGYPTDPVNNQDLDGKSWWGRAKRYARSAERSVWRGSGRASRWLTGNSFGARAIRTGCSFAWGGVGLGCNLIIAGACARTGNRRAARHQIYGAAAGAVGGGATFGLYRRAYRYGGGVRVSRHYKKANRLIHPRRNARYRASRHRMPTSVHVAGRHLGYASAYATSSVVGRYYPTAY